MRYGMTLAAILALFILVLVAGPANALTPTVLYSFDTTHGENPVANLTLVGSTLYGMTQEGGNNGYGTIFSMPTSGGIPTVLYHFDDTHGAYPCNSLTLNGTTLYGMTHDGGYDDYGTIFSISTSGGTPKILFSFDDTYGAYPHGSLTLDGTNLYGMTRYGGYYDEGVIFRIPASGGLPTILYNFDGTHGQEPFGTLVINGGTMYGMTLNGGAHGLGTIFSIPVAGNSLTVLYSFDGPHGANPYGDLKLSPDGAFLFGMTYNGGTNSQGVVFSLPVSGGTPKILLSFDNTTYGAEPYGSLTVLNSTLYGMTSTGGAYGGGTIFSIPAAGGTPTVLTAFNYYDGEYPNGSLTLNGSHLYGMTADGGDYGYGVVFDLQLPTVTLNQTTGGTVTASPIQVAYTPGTAVTIKATASLGYHFVNWSVIGGTVASSTTSITTLTVVGTCTVTANFALTPYTATVTPPANGTVTVSPTQAIYFYSNTATITGSADPGYSFVKWSLVGGTVASSTSSRTVLTVKGNVTLSASYHEIVYSSTLTHVGGTILFTPSHGPFYLGAVVGVTATPSTGWQFVSWSFTGASLTDSTVPTTSLTVLGNFALKANFSPITYGVSGVASPIQDGTVSVGSATGTIGQVISISQTANPGYGFIGWTVNDSGHGAKLNSGSAAITLGSSNVTVTAVYVIIYSNTLTTVGGGTLRMTPSHGPYYYGSVLGLTASAGTGWQFVNWTTTGASVISASSATTSLMVLGDFDVTANFRAIIYGVSGVASPAPDGSVSVGSPTGTIGQVISLSQTANAGYSFIGWKVSDGGHGAKLNSDSASLTFGSSNVSVTGSFTLIHYPVVVHQTTGGAVTLSPSQATYIYSQSGTLTATAKPGYSFVNWLVTGGSVASGTASKTVLTVTSTCSVTPSYYEFFYNNTLAYVGDGTILLSSSGPYPYGQVITVTALPDPEYTFKGWIVTSSGTLASKTAATTALTIHGDFTLTASYAYVGLLTTLCSFTGTGGTCPGGWPYGSLTLSGTTLYGTTEIGGVNNLGTIFRISTSGGTPTLLYSFSGTDGANPCGSLTLGGSTLYGMTSYGGSGFTGSWTGYGTVFSTPSTGGTPTILYSFTGNDGASPCGSLTLSGSTLYGMTSEGGANDYGVIFSIPTTGGSPTILYSFSGTTDGGYPYGSLTLSGSTLYGMASWDGVNGFGTVFGLPTSGGVPTILYSFSGTSDGAIPEGSLILSGSTLYGMTSGGGADNFGTVFRIPTSGSTPTILCSFDSIHGGSPDGSLALSGSYLYGMTSGGGNMTQGNGGYGTIFRIPTIGGSPTILFSFDDAHGAWPNGDLTLSGSTLYGMTPNGGSDDMGTVFRLPITVPLQYNLTVTPPTGGTVTVTPDQATYSPNALVSIMAQADTGSNFVSWSVVGGTVASKTSSQTLLTVTGNATLSASFHKTTYSDTLTDVGGKILFTPSHGLFYYDTVVGLTASANAGWQFVSWSATGATLTSSTDTTTSLTVLGNFNLTATYLALTYGVSGVASPTAGGTVSVSSATGTIGRVISISRSANPGYHFTNWTLSDGGHGAKFNSGSASITLGSSNATVTAGFALTNYPPVAVHQTTGGVVTLTPTQATYTYGQTGTLTATATTSYNFVSWSVTGGSVASNTSSQTVLTVTSTCSVTASYHKIVYSDTTTDIGGGKILMTPSNGPYYLGTVVALTASANPGWKFVSWSNTGGSVLNASSSKTSLTVDGNFDLTADFSALTYGVSGVANPAADGTVSVGSATGTIGQVVSISQTANAGFSFVKWLVSDGGHSAKLNSDSASITFGSSNVTVTASYTLSHYPVTVNQATGGAVTFSPSRAAYTYSQTGTLTATPTASYNFVSWSVTGGSVASGTSSKTTLTVTSSCSVTASFSEIVYTDTLSYINGAIILSNNGPYIYGQVIAATALAQSEYAFSGWSVTGPSTLSNSAAASTSVTVRDNFNLTVSYTYVGALKTLCSFTGTGACPGEQPMGSLTLSGSTLYGMTENGGANGFGTVFSIPTIGGTPAILYSFSGAYDGANPYGSLTLSGSTLYGMTSDGGTDGAGTIFSISTSGGMPTILYTFSGQSDGGNPDGSLILSGSTLYGMTYYGNDNAGTIFSLPTSGGAVNILYSFTGGNDGGYPNGSLTLRNSTLFGMTSQGGTNSAGTIFSIPTSGGTPNILYTFSGANDGGYPDGSLIRNGTTLYGMTSQGGADNNGTVFSIPISGGLPTILYTFSGATDGGQPKGSLVLGGSTLYGMTYWAGANGDGTIFSLPTSGGKPNILFTFDGEHGSSPNGDLTLSGSTLYGMDQIGGDDGDGTVFRLPVTDPLQNTLAVNTPVGGTVAVTPVQATYSSSALVEITAFANPDSSFVSWSVTGGTVASNTSSLTLLTVTGNVTLSASFNYAVYSDTLSDVGGTIHLSSPGPYIYGQEITVTASAQAGYVFNGWNVTGPSLLDDSSAVSTSLTVYSSFTLTADFVPVPIIMCTFTGTGGTSPGEEPTGDLTLSGSTLYGMTANGGASGNGTIFSLSTSGGTPTILFSFDFDTYGANPAGSLTHSGSTLYGMTQGGGANSCGTIFSIPTIGGTPTLLYTFSGGTTDGSQPNGALTLSNSTLYGMTINGGANNFGTIFSLPTSGGTPTLLYSFSGAPDGANPYGSLTLSGSTLYGMTSAGGDNNYGTIFSLPTSGGSPTILYSFGNYPDGSYPYGSLTLSGATLYGMTSGGGVSGGYGTVFSISTSGGTLSTLCSFGGAPDGKYPYGSLTLRGSTLYGMTANGGASNYGSIFSLPTSGGTATILYSFTGATDGGYPNGSLILSGSTLYGMTANGGNLSLNSGAGGGLVFSFSATGP